MEMHLDKSKIDTKNVSNVKSCLGLSKLINEFPSLKLQSHTKQG